MQNKSIELFVPGRLCLMGEHSDWAGLNKIFNSSIVPGKAIVTGVEQGIYAIATKNEKFIVKSSLPDTESEYFECDMDMKKLREHAQGGGYYSYVAGVASYICEWYHTGGVEITITKRDLPMKSGLSSSAAICVLVTKAFNELYKLGMSTLGIMNIAYWGEQRTPSRCGRLDQACAFGVTPVELTFDGNELDVDRIPLGGTFYYVFADLMAGKDTVKILADLNKAYPFPQNEMERALHEALGEDNTVIISRAKKYLENGDSKALGSLMDEAQALFDCKVAPMCPDELTSPVLHRTLNDENIRQWIYGGKGVGSQGDGTVQFLAKDKECQKKLSDYLENILHMTTYTLTLRPKTNVRKAIIPVAGFGTRLYPTTRGIKKEFCPVVDKDGLVKPGILVLLEELDSIGIDEICLILNKEEKEYYDDFFFKSISDEHYQKLTQKMKEYENRIQRISRKLTFVFQNEQKGFGHAVYQAKEFATGEPVLLLLGDTLYSSNTGVPVTEQLIDAYKNCGQSMIALQRVDINQVGSYGVFSGNWDNKDENIMRITNIAEKPTVDYAREYLLMKQKDGLETCFGAFGCYIITESVFDRLEYAIENNIVNSKDEVELTDALAYVCEKYGLLGYVPDGKSLIRVSYSDFKQ